VPRTFQDFGNRARLIAAHAPLPLGLLLAPMLRAVVGALRAARSTSHRRDNIDG
jgi:hypothetical protein